MKKHGTGQVLRDEEDTTKTAAAQPSDQWDEQAEQALAEENKDDE